MHLIVRIATVLFVSACCGAMAVERASVRSDGGQADGPSEVQGLSMDGRYVLFNSAARNLTSLIFPPADGLYVHDRITGSTTLALLPASDLDGTQSAFSADSNWIAVVANDGAPYGAPDEYQIALLERSSSTRIVMSVSSSGEDANRSCWKPSINGDGRYVAFETTATNLDLDTPADSTNSDIYVHDRKLGITECVSVTPEPKPDSGSSTLCSISRNGQWVVFHSTSTALVPGTTYPGGGGGLFLFDRIGRSMRRVDVGLGGVPADHPPNLGKAAISNDGRFVAFASDATNLVAGDTNGTLDVFVYDRLSGSISLASVSSAGVQGNDYSLAPSISLDGRYLTFRSAATTLGGVDTNGAVDVFLRDLVTGITRRVNVDDFGGQANGDSWFSTFISGDGETIAFNSQASNLIAKDTNNAQDVFLVPRKESLSVLIIGDLRADLAQLIAYLRHLWHLHQRPPLTANG